MKKLLVIISFCTILFLFSENEIFANHEKAAMEETNQSPRYLYKILSFRNWRATQHRKTVQLSAEDDAFIHFSTEDQLPDIVKKYWADAPQYVILKIDSNQLEGRLTFETTSGAVSSYRLYDRSEEHTSELQSQR